jgi:hypothetical protein
MKATVKILRVAGIRKSDRDISADPGTTGELRLSMVAQAAQLNLSDPNDQQFKPLVPMLYHARLVAMHGDRMLFQGLTARREEGGQPQEWSVQVMA